MNFADDEIDIVLTVVGREYPHQAGAGIEVIARLLLHVHGVVRRGQHLDRQVRGCSMADGPESGTPDWSECILNATLTSQMRSDGMSRMGVYDQIKKAFQDLIAPELHAIRGDIRVLDQKIDGVNANLTMKIDGVNANLTMKIDGVDSRLTTKIDAVDQKIDDLDVRLSTKIDSLRTETIALKGELLAEIRRVDVRIDGVDRELRTAIDIRERLAALEARRVS